MTELKERERESRIIIYTHSTRWHVQEDYWKTVIDSMLLMRQKCVHKFHSLCTLPFGVPLLTHGYDFYAPRHTFIRIYIYIYRLIYMSVCIAPLKNVYSLVIIFTIVGT